MQLILSYLNTASVPILLVSELGGYLRVRKFKYSFCSYSTQLQFDQPILDEYLNTASVPILRFVPMVFPKFPIGFKYSFCSYSTDHCQSLQTGDSYLNTASVPILPVRVEKMKIKNV